ncbi:MAG: sulfur carrier protein ThiS [Pseudomonadota bacterium]
MTIIVNGAPRETEAATLAGLLDELRAREGLSIEAVATAVNGVFAPAAARASTPLKERDAVEILSPRQGG